jgi:hypothetical protein
LRHAAVTGKRPAEGVLAAAGADYQDPHPAEPTGAAAGPEAARAG